MDKNKCDYDTSVNEGNEPSNYTTAVWCNRKVMRYAKKHRCSFEEAFKDIYGFEYKNERGKLL